MGLQALADQKDSQAQITLGNIYAGGLHKDMNKAIMWYTKSANNGSITAQFNLGGRYFSGEGVTRDRTQAFKWFEKSAFQGNKYAELMLGSMYYSGSGVEDDRVKSYAWLSISSVKGKPNTFLNKVKQQLSKDQLAKGEELKTELLKKIIKPASPSKTNTSVCLSTWASKNNALSQYLLADMYMWGVGVKKDIAKATSLNLKSAKNGNVRSQTSLGIRYTINLAGVKKDPIKGYAWFSIALSNNYNPDNYISKKLKTLESHMSESDLAKAKALTKELMKTIKKS